MEKTMMIDRFNEELKKYGFKNDNRPVNDRNIDRMLDQMEDRREFLLQVGIMK